MATVLRDPFPPLCSGDKLSRNEFMRIWEGHPEIEKAELIGGIVYTWPLVTVQHGDMHGSIGAWLGHYRVFTPEIRCAILPTCFMLDDISQPDVLLRIGRDLAGGSWV